MSPEPAAAGFAGAAMPPAPTPPAPTPSAEERRANAVYDALLWALSRPGQVRALPEVGYAQIVAALIDRECRVFTDDAQLTPTLLRAGAEIAPLPAADHAFFAVAPSPDVLGDVAQGSDLHPDDGATVIAPADLGRGARLRLSGPGVDGAVDVSLGGLSAGFWRERARIMRYPMGFELLLLDGDRVMGVPRSTTVEVL